MVSMNASTVASLTYLVLVTCKKTGFTFYWPTLYLTAQRLVLAAAVRVVDNSHKVTAAAATAEMVIML